VTIWHYDRQGSKGSANLDQMRKMIEEGKLLPDDLVRKDHSKGWVPAGSVSAFFETGAENTAASQPPPLPAQDAASALDSLASAVELPESAAESTGSASSEIASTRNKWKVDLDPVFQEPVWLSRMVAGFNALCLSIGVSIVWMVIRYIVGLNYQYSPLMHVLESIDPVLRIALYTLAIVGIFLITTRPKTMPGSSFPFMIRIVFSLSLLSVIWAAIIKKAPSSMVGRTEQTVLLVVLIVLGIAGIICFALYMRKYAQQLSKKSLADQTLVFVYAIPCFMLVFFVLIQLLAGRRNVVALFFLTSAVTLLIYAGAIFLIIKYTLLFRQLAKRARIHLLHEEKKSSKKSGGS